MSTVITMTSWKQRIASVGQCIWMFYKVQCKKPDVFYLILSEAEFPNKERDLPRDLLFICKYYGVIIRWVPYNDGCTKRWIIYPEHIHDTVAAIDEDAVYDEHLVERMSTINQYTGKVYTIWDRLNNYLVPTHGIGFRYVNYKIANLPDHSLRIKLLGNSVIPPNTFPLDALAPEYLPKRLKYCPKCDESWLMPFYRHNGIESQALHLAKWTLEDNMQKSGISANGRYINGTWWKDIQMYIVLRLFPELMVSWKAIFPEYDDAGWASKPVDELIKLIT